MCVYVCKSEVCQHLCTDCHQTSHTHTHTHTHTRTLKICVGWFLSPFRSARFMESGGNSASSRFNWRKVWTVVKCHFSSAHHHNHYVVGKLSITRVRMWNFTRIGRKTKKLRRSINPARRQWPGTTNKKVWTTTFLHCNLTGGTSLESSWLAEFECTSSPR